MKHTANMSVNSISIRKLLFTLIFAVACLPAIGQKSAVGKQAYSRIYAFWGWNRDVYSNSDIHFSGQNYDFTLKGVRGEDKPEKFGYDPFFHIAKLTIPQTNVRVGYFLSPKYSLSLGIDHMKYVTNQDQAVLISGNIEGTNTPYDGTYTNTPIYTDPKFLKFEHTDGLNYVNVELRRHSPIWSLHKSKWLSSDLENFSGFGIGALVPKTNVRMFDGVRNDEFHLAGYSTHVVTGLGLKLWNHFAIWSEFKGGYVNLPDIRTSINPIDRADQHFWFGEFDVLVGGTFSLSDFKRKQGSDSSNK